MHKLCSEPNCNNTAIGGVNNQDFCAAHIQTVMQKSLSPFKKALEESKVVSYVDDELKK